MMQTHRCRRCGMVIDAFVAFVPGVPIALSQQAIEDRVRASRTRHADRCPGPPRERSAEQPTTQPQEAKSRAPKRPPILAWRRRAAG